MLHTRKSFSVPATTPTKTLCHVHHIVKGKCLRCPHVVKEILNIEGEVKASGSAWVTRVAGYDSVPTDSEGAE